MTDAPINPPGGTSEQLPAALLALLTLDPYLSTACETAHACEEASDYANRSGRPWILAQSDRLHDRCRLNHKFTGALCICPCHQIGATS